MAMKDPKKIYPSYSVQLVWETHFEFTRSYREFSDFFFGKFVKLPEESEFGTNKTK